MAFETEPGNFRQQQYYPCRGTCAFTATGPVGRVNTLLKARAGPRAGRPHFFVDRLSEEDTFFAVG